MDWMNWLLGDEGIGARDVLGIGRDLVGGYFRGRGEEEDQRMTAEEKERARQFQRETGFINQDTPFGTVTNERDPVTGYWTRRTELNPEDQLRLDAWRTMAGDRMNHAASVKLPENVDFRASVNRFLPESLGGSYVATDYWGKK